MDSNLEGKWQIIQREPEGTFGDLLMALRRRRKTILTTMALLTIPSVLFALTREPTFTTTSQLVIEDARPSELDGRARPVASRTATGYSAEVALLQSDAVVGGTMEALGLLGDPEYQPRPTQVGALLARVLNQPVPAASAEADPARARQNAMEIFRQHLDVRNPDRSSVIEVQFSSRDAARAAEVANKLTEVYLTERLEVTAAAAARAEQLRSDKIAEQKKRVQEADDRLAQLTAQSRARLEDGLVSSAANADETMRQLNKVSASADALAARLSTIQKIVDSGGPEDSIGSLVQSPVLQQLRIKDAELQRQLAESSAAYGRRDRRTLMVKLQVEKSADLITREVDRTVQSMRAELAELNLQKDALATRLQTAQNAGTAQIVSDVEVQQAERDAVAKRAVYQQLLVEQEQQRGLAAAASSGAFVTSAAAVPMAPSATGPFTIAGVALVLSGLAGAGLALLREQSDKRLRSAAQLERVTNVPCLAMIPEPRTKGSRHATGFSERHTDAAYLEAVNRISASLNLAGARCKTVLVTSSVPVEGKTMTAVDLATSAARAGLRTLLIDFDVFQPGVVKELHFDPNPAAEGNGTIDIDAASANESGNAIVSVMMDSLVAERSTGLSVLTFSDARLRNGLRAGKMGSLLQALRRRFDLIVIDSPPLLGMSEGVAVARYVDASVFVVRWGETTEDVARAGIEALKMSCAGAIGAVYSHVDFAKMEAGGYGPDLRKMFGQYFGDRNVRFAESNA